MAVEAMAEAEAISVVPPGDGDSMSGNPDVTHAANGGGFPPWKRWAHESPDIPLTIYVT
jgi:hypothetical protein